MLRKLGNHFRKTPPAEDASVPHWVDANDNVFGIRVLDCRPLISRVTAWSANPDVANRFLELRRSDGREHVGRLPEDAIAVHCSLEYAFAGAHDEGALFRAGSMEEKWDMFLYGETLYAARSWTGTLVLAAQCHFLPEKVRVSSIAAGPATASSGPQYVERVLDFLIKNHMSGMIVPHPVRPEQRTESEEHLAVGSFSEFGSRGPFGTFEETRGILGTRGSV